MEIGTGLGRMNSIVVMVFASIEYLIDNWSWLMTLRELQTPFRFLYIDNSSQFFSFFFRFQLLMGAMPTGWEFHIMPMYKVCNVKKYTRYFFRMFSSQGS